MYRVNDSEAGVVLASSCSKRVIYDRDEQVRLTKAGHDISMKWTVAIRKIQNSKQGLAVFLNDMYLLSGS